MLFVYTFNTHSASTFTVQTYLTVIDRFVDELRDRGIVCFSAMGEPVFDLERGDR